MGGAQWSGVVLGAGDLQLVAVGEVPGVLREATDWSDFRTLNGRWCPLGPGQEDWGHRVSPGMQGMQGGGMGVRLGKSFLPSKW